MEWFNTLFDNLTAKKHYKDIKKKKTTYFANNKENIRIFLVV